MSERTARASAWVYEGIWSVLAQWFMVPQDPPTLPVVGETHAFRPAEGFLRYLKLWFWLGLLVVDVVIIGIWVAILLIEFWWGVVLAPLAFVLAVVPDIIAYIAIHLRYHTTWYVMTDRSLRIRRGIWAITEVTITFENVQNVHVDQGPVERYFGIADVTIETAGSGAGGDHHHGRSAVSNEAVIEGIADAAHIRDLVLSRVRRSRAAGLGDEATEKPSDLAGWSSEHLALLREIRDAARALRTGTA